MEDHKKAFLYHKATLKNLILGNKLYTAFYILLLILSAIDNYYERIELEKQQEENLKLKEFVKFNPVPFTEEEKRGII